VLLPDGRRTGLVRDALFSFGFANFASFVGPNISAHEGAETLPFPTAGIPLGATLSFVGVSVGPFGAEHVLTDAAAATFE
jgi:hypothetical protein